MSNKIDDFSVKLNNSFINCLSLIDNNVTLSTKTNVPIYIETKTDEYNFKYTINCLTTQE